MEAPYIALAVLVFMSIGCAVGAFISLGHQFWCWLRRRKIKEAAAEPPVLPISNQR